MQRTPTERKNKFTAMPVPIETAKRFSKTCKRKGLKIFVEVEAALLSHMAGVLK